MSLANLTKRKEKVFLRNSYKTVKMVRQNGENTRMCPGKKEFVPVKGRTQAEATLHSSGALH